jgi:hypothetical protein
MTWSEDAPLSVDEDPISDLELRDEDAQDVVGGSPADKQPYLTFGLESPIISSYPSSPPAQK